MPVTTENPIYSSYKTLWKEVRETIKGEQAIKAAGSYYLPKGGKTEKEYNAYQNRVKFISFTNRTADGLHGAIFSKPPAFSDNTTDELLKLLDDVNMEGDSLNQFASDVCWDAMQTNWGGILVDHTPTIATNKQEAERNGARPYLKWYTAENVINWKYEILNGDPQLSLVVLKEQKPKESDIFDYTTTDVYRVIRIVDGAVYHEIYETTDGEFAISETIPIRINGNPMTEIPFFPCPTKIPEKSMLQDLVNENISYYQLDADYKDYLHWCATVTGVITNWEPKQDPETNKPKPIPVGGSHFLVLNGDEGKNPSAFYLETSGSAASQLVAALNASRENMAVLGAHILTDEKRGVETAEAARIHRSGEYAVIASFARAMSEQFTAAVKLMAEWAGIDTDFSIQLNTNFDLSKTSEQFVSMILNARGTGDVPRTAVLNVLKQSGVLPETMTLDEYTASLERDKDDTLDE